PAPLTAPVRLSLPDALPISVHRHTQAVLLRSDHRGIDFERAGGGGRRPRRFADRVEGGNGNEARGAAILWERSRRLRRTDTRVQDRKSTRLNSSHQITSSAV